jgi:flagellar hook protein FlgE
LSDLNQAIRNFLSLPELDGTSDSNATVSIHSLGWHPQIKPGAMVIRSLPGAAYAIDSFRIATKWVEGSQATHHIFNPHSPWERIQIGADRETVSCPIHFFDGFGNKHTGYLTLAQSDIQTRWRYDLALNPGDSLLAGKSGWIQFLTDGSVSTMESDDGSTQLRVRPFQGAPDLLIDWDAGGPQDFSGLTLFSSPSSAAMVHQNGAASGTLKGVRIQENGIVTASYSNGAIRDLFQIPLARIPNPTGLQQIGANTFRASHESGEASLFTDYRGQKTQLFQGVIERVED